MESKCIRAYISGRVQGVFFRQSTKRQADQRNIKGHAYNLPDGRVEVLACGNAHSLDLLVHWLNNGPPMARVSSVEIETTTGPIPSDFKTG